MGSLSRTPYFPVGIDVFTHLDLQAPAQQSSLSNPPNCQTQWILSVPECFLHRGSQHVHSVLTASGLELLALLTYISHPSSFP